MKLYGVILVDYILSVDAGTTAFKTSIIDADGKLMGKSTKEYKLLTPDALSVELPADTFWNACKEGVKEVLRRAKINPKDIRALGLSVQGETLIVTDRNGKPLRNAIIWLDNRAHEEAEILSNEFDIDGLSYKITGQVKIVPTWPASKIFWIKRREKKTFEKAYKYLLLEDYLIYKMTGEFVSEGSLLCSTVYWNITTKKWWGEMLDYIGISADQLPSIKESGEVVDEISPNAAKEMGLSTDTIVTTGALDQASGAIGVGNFEPGIFSENTGAALAICATLKKPVFDKKRRMPIHYHGIPDIYMAHTFTTGGMVMRWFRDNFCKEEMKKAKELGKDAYDIIGREASKIPPGCEGLVMLPHLQGAMAPEANPKAKGVFYGLTLRHTKEHFARAIMETIAYIVRRNIDILEELKIPVTEIRVLGGGARSDIWNQIKADITGKPVIRTVNEEAACLGAAILAGKGVGMYKDIKDAVNRVVRTKKRFEPNEKNFEVYKQTYEKYVKLYESLCNLFEMEKAQ